MAATARAVDLTDVKEGGSFRTKRVPSGDYRAKIVKADDHQPNDKTKPMGWVLTIQIDGHARYSYPYYLSPDAKQAWKIGAICRAAGLNVKNARVRFDPNKLVGKAIGVAMDDDEYEGRPKSVVDDVFPVSEVGANADEDVPDDDGDIDLGDEVEEEEEVVETKPVARRRKPAPEPEPVEDDEEEEPEPTPPPRKRARKAAPPPPVEDDDEEEEDEDEEPAPPPRKRTAPSRRAKPAPAPVADDEDEDLDLDDLDEV